MNYANVGDAAEYLRFANDNMFVGINIEKPEAVDELEEILMPGFDFVIMGSQDLGLLYGTGEAGTHALATDTERRRSLCGQRGIAWGENPATLDGVRSKTGSA